MVSPINSAASAPPQVVSRPAPSASPSAAPEAVQAKSHVPVDMERMKQNLEVTIGRLNEQMRDGGRNVTFAGSTATLNTLLEVDPSGAVKVVARRWTRDE